MKNSKLKLQNRRFIFFCLLHLAFGVLSISAQSTSQSFPTPVTSGEISGTVRARDLGDARLTSYFYVLDGRQGDIFINVVTKNFDGNIDVFTADNLRPLTKIVVYSDTPDSETGRVVYLRQPQKLILRIEGRTPDDNPATYRIKFAGSFSPLAEVAATDETKQPEVKTDEESGVRVNSVGTIIEVRPKPTPTPAAETTARAEKTEPVKPAEPDVAKPDPETVAENTRPAEKPAPESKPKTSRTRKPKQKPEVVVADNAAVPEKRDEAAENKSDAEKTAPETVIEQAGSEGAKPAAPKTRKTAKNAAAKFPKSIAPGELVNINLVIMFKDGTKIERSMSDVLKVGVDQGILTIIYKNGSIGRYSILEVAKMTIE
jgi:hypothetical protein